MKKILIILFCLMFTAQCFSQVIKPVTQRDSILCDIRDAANAIKFYHEYNGQYKLYPTENIHILLKLDTSTGIIKLVQWSLEKEKEFEIYINADILATGLLATKGRFELYPTKNMYQFILLDTLMGETWHVQWGTKENERWIRKISY